MKKDTKLTSVKILESLYNKFKIDCVKSKTTLQRLTNRSIHLYLNNQNFRDQIKNHNDLTVSGSNF